MIENEYIDYADLYGVPPAEMKIKIRNIFEYFPDIPSKGYYEAAIIDDNRLNPELEEAKIIDKGGKNPIIDIPSGGYARAVQIAGHATQMYDLGFTKRKDQRVKYRSQILGGFEGLLKASLMTNEGAKYATDMAETAYDQGERTGEVGQRLYRTLELDNPDSVGPYDPLHAERIDANFYKQFQREVLGEFYQKKSPIKLEPFLLHLSEWRKNHHILFNQRI